MKSLLTGQGRHHRADDQCRRGIPMERYQGGGGVLRRMEGGSDG